MGWLSTDSSDSERSALAALLLVVALIGSASLVFGASRVPLSVLLLPIMVSALRLTVRGVGVLLVGVAAVVALELSGLGWSTSRIVVLVVLAVGGVFAGWVAQARQRVGGLGLRGESMLLELRDALREQGTLPPLPADWRCEVELEAAYGQSFGGDFVVSALRQDGHTLEIALVDVSGKGIDAGTRALLCSGAFGALLGAVPPEQFLPAANTYLMRQDWIEGFATAVHLVLDLRTGAYTVESAGHPPAAQFAAGSGQWRLADADGLALGLLPRVRYTATHGRIGSGDALLLYTDGVVETPGRDLSLGIDKLAGEAERLIGRGFTGGARRLLAAMRSGASDDRAIVMLWRR
jgi:hypothetical protein